MACVRALSGGGFNLAQRAFRVDATYSRFYVSRPQALRDPADEGEMRDAIAKLYGEAKEKFPKVEAVLRSVFLPKQ
jgi:hypothetical protein